jgi:hypothetical protein
MIIMSNKSTAFDKIRKVHDWISALSSPRFYSFVCCPFDKLRTSSSGDTSPSKLWIPAGVYPREGGDGNDNGMAVFKFYSRKIVFTIAAFVFTLCIVSCGDKGEFAYKSFEMDSYRTMKKGMEFPSDSKTDWLYKIATVSGKKRYGVIMLKKELVWTEISKGVQVAEIEKPNLYGVIQRLEPGEYKIMITRDNKLVDENEFTVYDPRIPERDDD